MRPLSRLLPCLAATAGILFAPLPALAGEPAPIEQDLFDSWIGKYPDLTTEGLNKLLGISSSAQKPLSFAPSGAAWYDRVVNALSLSKDAKARLEKEGLVLVPQGQTYSMAAALYAIYTSDLPLLVTTDAILDAMHRSFDDILAEMEQQVLRPALKDALSKAQQALPAFVKAEPQLAQAAKDCDLYLTVALNLLETEPNNRLLLMAPRLVLPPEVQAILAKVHALELENPAINGRSTKIYGEDRAVDWSQFKPRGHYEKSPELQRYFRALMWLGRADTGFAIEKPRQLRAAAVLTRLLDSSGASARLQVLRDVVDLMVGRSDNLTPSELLDTVRREKLHGPGALAGDASMKRLADSLAASGLGAQRIRSQLVVSQLTDPKKVPPPGVFQLFGQRFILDSFVLSKVVYDDIHFKGEKQNRRMPTGLDVMAALGNDLAVALLRPELDRWHYGANLATLRDVIAAWSDEHWNDSLYNLWLDSLRSIAKPPSGKGVPEVMNRDAWGRKMLQTQLASWAQLRHDTILYAKQSYTASVGCVYPAGFVEPYPEFYGKLGRFAQIAATRFKALGKAPDLAGRMDPYVAYFENFNKIMSTLRGMADDELAGRAFSKEEEQFLKNTIEKTDGGGGYAPTPDWTGWYISLIYPSGDIESAAVEAKPTIADVHTDPDSGDVLEVGTGNVDFIVAAIDNHGDRGIYVGPTFSYYEFTHDAKDRLTDSQWQKMLEQPKTTPARPSWILPLISK